MRRGLSRVPSITIYFWLIKILATTVGETAADFFAFTLNLGLSTTSYLMSGLLLAAIFNQFKLKRYVPTSYWTVVVLISIVGTLITDRLVDEMGVSLLLVTILCAIALIIVLALWYASERTLAMHSIRTAKREIWYWITILLTFALGTAAGDLLAEKLQLGYALSTALFAATIAVVAFGYTLFKLNTVLAFWLCYVLTRPLGASFGDLLSQPQKNGGLGLGTVGTSLVFISSIISLVIYLSRKSKTDSIKLGSIEPNPLIETEV